MLKLNLKSSSQALTKRRKKKQNVSVKKLFSESRKRHISVIWIDRQYAEISWNSK